LAKVLAKVLHNSEKQRTFAAESFGESSFVFIEHRSFAKSFEMNPKIGKNRPTNFQKMNNKKGPFSGNFHGNFRKELRK
jgi:hypothetical protein